MTKSKDTITLSGHTYVIGNRILVTGHDVLWKRIVKYFWPSCSFIKTQKGVWEIISVGQTSPSKHKQKSKKK